ncbi:putative Ubiquitin superfamily protein [Quillaja saponaria]|uniref:Ubiquitin superfamily protein n=1 Tax=Quillaja saponaria TaxID=32244 RepID=A0AAD7KYA5_QUISA|nr:putative Ubiquitin superfamily protein [Quillaja saponaria]
MKIVLENLTGTLFYVQLGHDATVADLKRQIEAQQKLPCDRLILFLDNHSCLMNKEEEEISLVDCGVQEGSHIYLFINPLDDGSGNHFVFTCPDTLFGLT